MTATHDLEVVPVGSYYWRARCSCGWQGEVHGSGGAVARCWRDAEAHRDDDDTEANHG